MWILRTLILWTNTTAPVHHSTCAAEAGLVCCLLQHLCQCGRASPLSISLQTTLVRGPFFCISDYWVHIIPYNVDAYIVDFTIVDKHYSTCATVAGLVSCL